MMRAVLIGLALASAAAAQEPPPGTGPRGTSGEVHDDSVGIATVLTVTASTSPTIRIAAMHPTLPAGSFVEVTALDTGRTIAAMVVGPYRGRGVVGLSPDAAQALGIAAGAAVRVRSTTPSPQDQSALRHGQAAGQRLDAPPALLAALRRKVPGGSSALSPVGPRRTEPARPAAPPEMVDIAAAPVRPAPATRPAAAGRYGVQVATLSVADRADALARMLGGHVVPVGRLFRVQLGPFADAASAARARDAVARQGHGDARVFHSE